MDHERPNIIWEFHNGVARGHVGGKCTEIKILQAGLLWPTVRKDAKEYDNKCDMCQRNGKLSHRDELPCDELPLQPVRAIHEF